MPPHVTSESESLQERWLPVVGYEGMYEVSSYGRVRSVARVVAGGHYRRGKMLSPAVSNGYLYVQLSKDSRQRAIRIHSLVANAFFGPCPVGHNVNHIDGDKANNCVGNLEYVTYSENVRHAVKIGRMGKLSKEAVWEIREACAANPEMSLDVLAKKFGIVEQTVARILRCVRYASVPNRDGTLAMPLNRRAKLAEVDVYALHQGGKSLNAIAREYGVNPAAVWRAYHKAARLRVVDNKAERE